MKLSLLPFFIHTYIYIHISTETIRKTPILLDFFQLQPAPEFFPKVPSGVAAVPASAADAPSGCPASSARSDLRPRQAARAAPAAWATKRPGRTTSWEIEDSLSFWIHEKWGLTWFNHQNL